MWFTLLYPLFRRFVVSNDAFKFKEFNLDSKQCRKTSLAPRFGNPPRVLLPIPFGQPTEIPFSQPMQLQEGGMDDTEAPEAPPLPLQSFFAFATNSRVVGISSFPLTGDPSQVQYICLMLTNVTSMCGMF